MQLQEAIDLIQTETLYAKEPQQWADLGCGAGLFTRALVSFLTPGSTILAIDKNMSSFQKFSSPGITIQSIEADFITNLPPINNNNGILMANSLHYVQYKKPFIHILLQSLIKDGCLLIVEYDTDVANAWVPYPVSFQSLRQLFSDAGYTKVAMLRDRISVYNRAKMYAAVITK